MIKPSDVALTQPVERIDPVDWTQRNALEHSFDAAIRKSRLSGRWPAVVSRERDGLRLANLEAVVELYRNAGWRVETANIGGDRAHIHHPGSEAARG